MNLLSVPNSLPACWCRCCWLCLITTPLLLAEKPRFDQPPHLERIQPLVWHPGKRTPVALSGKYLSVDQTLSATFPLEVHGTWQVSSDGMEASADLSTNQELTPQISVLRVRTAQGASQFLPFLVDRFPCVPATQGIHSIEKAQVVPLGCVVDGSIAPQTTSHFRIRLAKPTRVRVEVVAARLRSPLDPLVSLSTADGRLLASSDDTEGMGGDCRLSYQAQQAGEYLVSLRDVRNEGGSSYRYALRVGEFAFVRSQFPLGIQRGSTGRVEVLTDTDQTTVQRIEARQEQDRVWVDVDRVGTSTCLIVSDQPEMLEHEPNDQPETAQSMVPGIAINGRFRNASDRDCFKLQVGKGESYSFQPQHALPGLATRVYLRLKDAEGKMLAEAAQTGAGTGAIHYRFDEAGTVILVVEELQRRGGKAFSYRIDVRRDMPDFRLVLETERLSAPPGGVLKIPVRIERENYKGPIELAMRGLPDGAVVAGTDVPAEKDAGELRIRMPTAETTWPQQCSVVGRPPDTAQGEREVVAHFATDWTSRFRGIAFPPTSWVSQIPLAKQPPRDTGYGLRTSRKRWWMPVGHNGIGLRVAIERAQTDTPQDDGETPDKETPKNAPQVFTLSVEGLPVTPELSLNSISADGKWRQISIGGLKELPSGTHAFRIVTSGTDDHGPLDLVHDAELRVGPPLALSVDASPLLPGVTRHPLFVRVSRHHKHPRPVQLRWKGVPQDARIEGPEVIGANQNAALCYLVSDNEMAQPIALVAEAETIAKAEVVRDPRIQPLGGTPGAEEIAEVTRWEAETFDAATAGVFHDGYGEGIGIVSDRAGQGAAVEYVVQVEHDGQYQLEVRYAAEKSRAAVLSVNGDVVKKDALAQTTGGWYPQHQRWHFEAEVKLRSGENRLRLESSGAMVHLDKLLLAPLRYRYEVPARFDSWVSDGSSTTAAQMDGNLVSVFASNAPTGKRRVGILGFVAPDVESDLVVGAHLELGVDGRDGTYSRSDTRSTARLLNAACQPEQLNYAAYLVEQENGQAFKDFGKYRVKQASSQPAGSYERSALASASDLELIRSRIGNPAMIALGLEADEDGSGTARDWGANDNAPQGTHGGPLSPRLVLHLRKYPDVSAPKTYTVTDAVLLNVDERLTQ